MIKRELTSILNKHKRWLNADSGGVCADLSDADLGGADLSDVDLARATLRGANLRYADLSRANLDGADLTHANLYGANLHSANLCRADLSGADLSGTNLRNADLYGANLRNALGSRVILTAGYIGSRHAETVYDATQDRVQCGCFDGTLAEFKAKVAETYPDKNSLHRREYEAAIAYFKAVAKARKLEEKTNKERN